MSKTDLRLISLRLPADLLGRVDALAGAKHETRSAMIEHLLRDAIDSEELLVRAMTDPIVAPAILGAMAQPEVLRAMTATMRQQLTDEQLQLFTKSMHALEQQTRTPAAAKAATPRRRPKQKKRGK